MSLTKKKNEIQKSHKSKVNTPTNYDKLKKKMPVQQGRCRKDCGKIIQYFPLILYTVQQWGRKESRVSQLQSSWGFRDSMTD